MRYLSPDEFESKFPRRESLVEIGSMFPGDLTVDRHSVITGIVKGSVLVKGGAQAEIRGIVHGNVRVEADGVVYLGGIVQGDVEVDGSAHVTGCVSGAVSGFN